MTLVFCSCHFIELVKDRNGGLNNIYIYQIFIKNRFSYNIKISLFYFLIFISIINIKYLYVVRPCFPSFQSCAHCILARFRIAILYAEAKV